MDVNAQIYDNTIVNEYSDASIKVYDDMGFLNNQGTCSEGNIETYDDVGCMDGNEGRQQYDDPNWFKTHTPTLVSLVYVPEQDQYPLHC